MAVAVNAISTHMRTANFRLIAASVEDESYAGTQIVGANLLVAVAE
jgi:hypothetical protein